MSELDLDKELQHQIGQLPKQLKPSRDLWTGIDHAIEQELQAQVQQQHTAKLTSWPKLSAVAAGFVVFGFSTWMVMNVEPSIGVNDIASNEPMSYVSQITDSFEQQKQSLLVKYQDQQAYADDWQLQLKELDDAASAIKKALAIEPGNAQLIKMLQQTYQQQLDLIKAVNKSPWQTI